jgi:hypothetical protein
MATALRYDPSVRPWNGPGGVWSAAWRGSKEDPSPLGSSIMTPPSEPGLNAVKLISNEFFGVATSGTTYPQTCYATGSGAVSRSLMPIKVFTISGTGAVSRLLAISKVFTTSGTAAVSRIRSIGKVFTVSASGAVSASQTLVTFVVQQCYATGSAAVTLGKTVTKLLSAAGSGAATLTRMTTKTLATTGQGTVSRIRTITKAFAVAGTGATSLVRKITKTFSTTGTATVAYSDALVLLKQLIAAGSGAVSSIQTFIGAGPPLPPYRKWRRAMLNYLKRR